MHWPCPNSGISWWYILILDTASKYAMKMETENSKGSPCCLFFPFFETSKLFEKIHERRQYCILSVRKYPEQNMLYLALGENEKISKFDQIE
jgi:hypothetical protein